MSGVLLAIAGVVWLVAAYAFVRVAMAWLSVVRLAPAGQKFGTALDLGLWNFQAVMVRLGAAADPHIRTYQRSFMLFFGAVGGFMLLTIVNIATGNAA